MNPVHWGVARADGLVKKVGEIFMLGEMRETNWEVVPLYLLSTEHSKL